MLFPPLPQMVQTMVLVLHRQWLSLSASQQPNNSAGLSKCQLEPKSPFSGPCLPAGVGASAPWWLRPAASLLREALLLLHWLLLHHSSFSESCRPLLHMYDQVIPAVQDLLRRVPERSESEGEHVHVRVRRVSTTFPRAQNRQWCWKLKEAVLDCVPSLSVRGGFGRDLPLGW